MDKTRDWKVREIQTVLCGIRGGGGLGGGTCLSWMLRLAVDAVRLLSKSEELSSKSNFAMTSIFFIGAGEVGGELTFSWKYNCLKSMWMWKI